MDFIAADRPPFVFAAVATLYDATPNRAARVGIVATVTIGLIAVSSYLILVLRRLSGPAVKANRQIRIVPAMDAP